MVINTAITGLIFTLIGALILFLNTIFGKWHQKDHSKHWTKRYYWEGRRPIFKVHPPNEKAKWRIKWYHIVLVEGFMPPKYFWELIGFLFILIGVILQIKSVT